MKLRLLALVGFILAFSCSTMQSAPRVRLSWQDNSSPPDGEEVFVIERAVGAAEFVELAVVGQNVVEFFDDTIQPGRSYRYRVKARNWVGDSGYSNEATLTVPSLPAAPGVLQAAPVVTLIMRLDEGVS